MTVPDGEKARERERVVRFASAVVDEGTVVVSVTTTAIVVVVATD